jgi:hypothetical protein
MVPALPSLLTLAVLSQTLTAKEHATQTAPDATAAGSSVLWLLLHFALSLGFGFDGKGRGCTGESLLQRRLDRLLLRIGWATSAQKGLVFPWLFAEIECNY